MSATPDAPGAPNAPAPPARPRPPPDAPMLRERARARRMATTIVSWALALAGVVLLVLAVVLVLRGGAPLILLAIIVGIIGLGLAIAGFFFQLVPLRLDELAEAKRDHDRRTR